MSTTQPSALQLWIRNRCIAVEKRFVGRTPRAPFAATVLPAAAVLAYAFFNPNGLPAYVLAPFVVVAFCFAIAATARRFHDIGSKGANLLQILIPLFIALWIGPKIPDIHHLPLIVTALLCLWPALTLLRLLLTPSAPASPSSVRRFVDSSATSSSKSP